MLNKSQENYLICATSCLILGNSLGICSTLSVSSSISFRFLSASDEDPLVLSSLVTSAPISIGLNRVSFSLSDIKSNGNHSIYPFRHLLHNHRLCLVIL